MKKKKQGSLSNKILKTTSLKKYVIDKKLTQTQQNGKKIRLPSTCLTLMKVNQFIQHYQIIKQQYNFNSSSNQIQMLTKQKNNDLEFHFDVDLGVPYVQSKHLDSGFQFQQKHQDFQNSYLYNKNVPIISSGKQIFTSILQVDKKQVQEDLQQENFTDQQQEEQQLYIQEINKNSKLSSKSRKQTPSMIIQNSQSRKYQNFTNLHQNKCLLPNNNTSLPLTLFIQKSFPEMNTQKSLQPLQQDLMKRLRMTAQFREQKLKYWNNKLQQMQKQKIRKVAQHENINKNTTKKNNDKGIKIYSNKDCIQNGKFYQQQQVSETYQANGIYDFPHQNQPNNQENDRRLRNVNMSNMSNMSSYRLNHDHKHNHDENQNQGGKNGKNKISSNGYNDEGNGMNSSSGFSYNYDYGCNFDNKNDANTKIKMPMQNNISNNNHNHNNTKNTNNKHQDASVIASHYVKRSKVQRVEKQKQRCGRSKQNNNNKENTNKDNRSRTYYNLKAQKAYTSKSYKQQQQHKQNQYNHGYGYEYGYEQRYGYGHKHENPLLPQPKTSQISKHEPILQQKHYQSSKGWRVNKIM